MYVACLIYILTCEPQAFRDATGMLVNAEENITIPLGDFKFDDEVQLAAIVISFASLFDMVGRAEEAEREADQRDAEPLPGAARIRVVKSNGIA